MDWRRVVDNALLKSLRLQGACVFSRANWWGRFLCRWSVNRFLRAVGAHELLVPVLVSLWASRLMPHVSVSVDVLIGGVVPLLGCVWRRPVGVSVDALTLVSRLMCPDL